MIPLDKQAHFLGGYALTLTIGLYNPILGLTVGIIAAISKEIYDYKHPLVHTADVKDFIATSLGSLTALIPLLVLN